MTDLLYVGQWQGFYQYGREYGPYVQGKEAEFRLFIEEYRDGQFSGKAIDWDGFGADGQVSEVKGFIDEELISITKQYAHSAVFDEWGNCLEEVGNNGHMVSYEGRFVEEENCFVGTWEIVTELEHTPHETLEYVVGGTWRLYRFGDGEDFPKR